MLLLQLEFGPGVPFYGSGVPFSTTSRALPIMPFPGADLVSARWNKLV